MNGMRSSSSPTSQNGRKCGWGFTSSISSTSSSSDLAEPLLFRQQQQEEEEEDQQTEQKSRRVLSKRGASVRQSLSEKCEIHKSVEQPPPTIECVFVAKFHNTKGNTVEWLLKEDDLIIDGVEDKALVSGFHRIDRDYVYFKHGENYGLACFHKLLTQNEAERNARMRSVGILGPCYKSLGLHLHFLAEQARRLNNEVESDQVYSDLQHLYKKWNRTDEAKMLALNHGNEFPLPQNDAIQRFIALFDKNIMILWKALLLKKRILFYTPVPLGDMCHQVFSMYAIAVSRIPMCQKCGSVVEPFFYVTLNDVSKLESIESYIAITTNQIFRDKSDMFDVMFDGKSVYFGTDGDLTKSLEFTKGDATRYQALMRLLKKAPYDSPLLKYFRSLNEGLFNGLQQVCEDESRVFLSDLPDFGLHESDQNFFLELCETYELDISFSEDQTFFCVPLTMCGGTGEQLFNPFNSKASNLK